MTRIDERPLVLVADDEADVTLLCRINLEFEGFRVVEASDGRDAVAKAKAERPSVVVLDATMPVQDGFQTLDELKADPELAEVPVVMLTGHVERAQQARAVEAGASVYLTKPFKPAELVAAVRQCLKG
jgi:CheY-like chemotaxis protein